VRRALAVVALAVVVSCASLPSVVKDEMAKTPPGTATVVFFTDFECPFCRRTHAALAPLLAARKDHVRVVLRHVPLPMHPHARGAARAALCAEDLGAKDGYADALFTSFDLGDSVCENLAVQRGVDREAFQRCVHSPLIDERIDKDIAAFDSTNGDGVPLLFVGARRLDGAQPPSVLEAALDDAIAASRSR
jgi:protein-disulfide isomerase